MMQSQLNRTLARATGESVRRIRKMGFILIPMNGMGKNARRAREGQMALADIPFKESIACCSA
jgi:hypothetical protein